MAAYQVRIERREEIATGTMAFHLEKPRGFSFVPGQAVTLELLEPPAGEGQGQRTFSIVSAPFEDTLLFATRMRDTPFKRALKGLPDGARVKLDGPYGELQLGDDARPAVLIAGGIGITPFISMLRQATQDRSSRRLRLVYSNRRPEDAAFLAELQGLEGRNANFRLLATMTDMRNSARNWDGETRLVDAGLLQRSAGDLAAPVYYVVGPPAMVEAMKQTLKGAGVAAADLRTEEFYGY
jgi:ferredoxin-NADP reductase